MGIHLQRVGQVDIARSNCLDLLIVHRLILNYVRFIRRIQDVISKRTR